MRQFLAVNILRSKMSTTDNGKARLTAVTSGQISWTIIAVTCLVAIYVYRTSLFVAFQSVAQSMNPTATIAALAACMVALVALLIRLGKSNRKISREVRNREKQILFHQDRHDELAQSQQKYKSLYEDAMRAAYQDLEKLNADLREKQDKLAAEIEGHKQTDSALKESELRWMKLVEKNPEAIVITIRNIIAYANPAGLSVLGANTFDELRGIDMTKFLPDQISKTIAGRGSVTEETEKQEPLEFEITGLDDEVRLVEMHIVPAVFRGKQASQNVLRDVTDKRRSERAVRKYTDQLRAMVEIERMMLLSGDVSKIAAETLAHLPDLVRFSHGMIVEFNELTGEVQLRAAVGIHDADHAIDASPLKGRKWEWSQEFQATRENASAEHEKFRQWMRYVGSQSYLYLPLGARGETLGAIVVGRDEPEFDGKEVSTIREFADLLALGINQARIMEERMNYEMEILSAKEHAEELVQLKTAFLTNMSHEIRTPLTGIIGFAQILNEEIDDRHKEFVELIEASGKRLLGTINSVLDLARLESGRVAVKRDVVDVAQVIRDSTTTLQSLAMKKGVSLTTQGVDDTVMAETDKAGLERILNNLVGNAIKFTDEGSVTVRLSSTEDTIKLEVEDTGIGISEQFLPFIFDDFKQESQGASRSHEGSGMGLSITRKLVEVMSGEIEVRSIKSEGSTFAVTLPRRLAQKWSAAEGETETRAISDNRRSPIAIRRPIPLNSAIASGNSASAD